MQLVSHIQDSRDLFDIPAVTRKKKKERKNSTDAARRNLHIPKQVAQLAARSQSGQKDLR